MSKGQANARRPEFRGTRWPAAVALITVVAGGASWARWERTAELAPGIPRPGYARLDAADTSPRGACSFDLRVEGPPEEVHREYGRRLRAAGWEERGRNGERVEYGQGRRSLRVTVRTPLALSPAWSRVRIVATRCDVAP